MIFAQSNGKDDNFHQGYKERLLHIVSMRLFCEEIKYEADKMDSAVLCYKDGDRMRYFFFGDALSNIGMLTVLLDCARREGRV